MALCDPPVSSEERRRLAAPSQLKIDFSPNLAGVAVRVSAGPSARDPLDQRGLIRHFKTLDDAIGALAELVTAHLDEHHAVAAAQAEAEEQRLRQRGEG